MKKKLMIGIIVAISMSAIGCGKDVNKLQADEAIQKYLESDSGDDLLNKIKKKAVIADFEGEEGTYEVSLNVPDLDTMTNIAKNDSTGFCSEYQMLKLEKCTDEESKQFVKQYFAKILGTTCCGIKQMTLEVNGENVDASELEKYVLTYDYDGVLSGLYSDSSTVETGNLDTELAQDSIKMIKTSDTFMFTKDKKTFQVSNVVVKEGSDAVQEINKLSAANNFKKGEGKCYYLTYDITNLASESCLIKNGFAMVSDGTVIELKSDVTGLKIVNKIDSGETKQFSCFVAGPDNSELYWLSTRNGKGTNGSYTFNVVL